MAETSEVFGSIDEVLNSETMIFENEEDDRRREDSFGMIDPDELDGIDAAKESGREGNFLLFELPGERYVIRGFERLYQRHLDVANKLLSRDVANLRGFVPDISLQWPLETRDRASPKLDVTIDEDMFAIRALGGGKYRIEDDVLHTYGSSGHFGSIPEDKVDVLERLLEKLVQREDYPVNDYRTGKFTSFPQQTQAL